MTAEYPANRNDEHPSVLVAGFSTRHIASSAHRAGYRVYAVDHFCDQDLFWNTEDRTNFEELEELPLAIATMEKRHAPGGFVPASGAEAIGSETPVLGTPPQKVLPFLDKLEIQRFFEKNGIPVPPELPQGTFPAMLKPRIASGGWRNAIVRSPAEEDRWKELFPGMPFLRQDIVGGVPSSVSLVADGRKARAVAVNEQLLRGAGEASFGFCGSITPSDHPLADLMVNYAEKAAGRSGCIGSVGIDFVAGDDEVYAIEINPRFQGTLDTVEASISENLFSLHMNACRGSIPEGKPPARRYAMRRILFAEQDLTVRSDPAPLAPMISDIPWPGTRFRPGEAVVSVHATGPDRTTALAALDRNMNTVRQYMAEWANGGNSRKSGD